MWPILTAIVISLLAAYMAADIAFYTILKKKDPAVMQQLKTDFKEKKTMWMVLALGATVGIITFIISFMMLRKSGMRNPNIRNTL